MRYVLAIFGLLVVVGGLAGIKFKQISGLIEFGKEMQKAGPPPEAVSTAIAQEQKWQGTLTAVGSISPAKGVTVSNEVAGVVTAIRFESGSIVKQGQVLVELDTSVERAQLASSRARRELAQLNAGRSRTLVQENVIPRSQLDGDEATLKSSAAEMNALQAQIEKKTIRAPFTGRLGIRGVNLGQFLDPGTAITVLQGVEASYADFSLPQQRLSELAVGMTVRATIDGDPTPVEGAISAIDPTVDATTRTIKVRASLANVQEKLRPGMFVNVSVMLPDQGTRVTIPATALVHASYGDSVFIVDPGQGGGKVARQQFVRAGESRGDYVAILEGVKPGEAVVVAGAFKLRNGASVAINNNDVKLDPQLAPKPENR